MLIIFFFICFFLISSKPSSASVHQTLIINQVRAQECCSQGSLDNLKLQLQTLKKLNLAATFTLRYDVLKNQDFLNVIKQYKNDFEWGAFLEITLQFAKEADVIYLANNENWYEAQFAYLIGYSQEDRTKLIDTYMRQFFEIFNYYPKTSTAWMIDNFSLQLLANKYEISTHQITREQLGVDSYTLYGGPAHYPYYPSKNWAMIPNQDEKNDEMPIIIRQTITDPVLNYGDETSSYTSQPNDYKLQNADLNYFKHLFLQAHSTNNDQDTFALIGLENSMPLEIQQEFAKQLEFVANWQKENENRQILPTKNFAETFRVENNKNKDLLIYGGQKKDDASEKAWFIDTPFYRLRLRLSDGEISVSDLRIYDENWLDPYSDKKANKLGFWIVPFIIDGSRYFYKDTSNTFDNLANDVIKNRANKLLEPSRLILTKKIVNSEDLTIELIDGEQGKELLLKLKNKIIAKFSKDKFSLPKKFIDKTQNQLLTATIKKFNWYGGNNEKLFGLEEVEKNKDFISFEVKISQKAKEMGTKILETERIKHYPLLFPEIKDQSLSVKNTYLLKSNRFAMSSRNPVRLVFFPKDEFDYPISLKTEPKISTSEELDAINIKTQSGQNGMVFLDFESKTPKKVEVLIEKDGWSEKLHIYFAPDCKSNKEYCLKHPVQAIWYLRNLIGDKWRALAEKFDE